MSVLSPFQNATFYFEIPTDEEGTDEYGNPIDLVDEVEFKVFILQQTRAIVPPVQEQYSFFGVPITAIFTEGWILNFTEENIPFLSPGMKTTRAVYRGIEGKFTLMLMLPYEVKIANDQVGVCIRGFFEYGTN